MFGWLRRLFARSDESPALTPAQIALQRPKPIPVESLSPEQFRINRRQVIAYIHRVRVPIRQAAAARLIWISDLGKVYEAIRTSPTQFILEKAGEVGYNHEPAFRDALSIAQSIEPTVECLAVHEALVGWLTSLHSACLALMDARRLKDRSLLGSFREHLSTARRQAGTLAAERELLFSSYRLNIRPTIKAKRGPVVIADDGTEVGSPSSGNGAPEPIARRRGGQAPKSSRGKNGVPRQMRDPRREATQPRDANRARGGTRRARPA